MIPVTVFFDSGFDASYVQESVAEKAGLKVGTCTSSFACFGGDHSGWHLGGLQDTLKEYDLAD